MGLKFKLILHKEIEVNTDKDWGGDLSYLIEYLRDDVGVAPGDQANSIQIASAIEAMLENDHQSVIDLDLEGTDFAIEVGTDQTVEVPEEEDEEVD